MNLPEMLQVIHLCKDYPTRSGPLSVLRDISLCSQPGTVTALVGPSRLPPLTRQRTRLS